MKKRSVEVTILGALTSLWGARQIMSLLYETRLFSAIPEYARSPATVECMIALAWLIAGIGVLMLGNWARLLTLITAGASALYELNGFSLVFKTWIPLWTFQYHTAMYNNSSFFSGGFGLELLRWLGISLKSIFPLACYGGIVWYLLRPGVKAQFVKTATRDT